jgi:hypothetical protein
MAAMPQRLLLRTAQLALALLVGAYLLYFADHARQIFAFAYPLDYGEGPLLAQVEALRAGTPIWRLYSDPAAPPYLIINYPPVYLLLTAGLAQLTDSVLLAGRLISLLAALGIVVAIVMLAAPADARRRTNDRGQTRYAGFSAIGYRLSAIGYRLSAIALALLFLTVPVVREWAALMRVDMLGVCLGLWGLVVLTRGSGPTPARAAAAGLLLAASLLTKPSLIAAPGAACLWLVWRAIRPGPTPSIQAQHAALPDTHVHWARDQKQIVILSLLTTMALAGGLVFALLQWASDGWFALHVVAANANSWELELARAFWRQQLALRWPLAAAAALAVAWALWLQTAARTRPAEEENRPQPVASTVADVDDEEALVQRSSVVGRRSSQSDKAPLALALLYTLFGAVTAAGVGKVGAYSNYFLELYAGLIWLVALGLTYAQTAQPGSGTLVFRLSSFVLLAASLLYYPPLWDATRLRPAGLIEPSPPRLAFGRYGLWDDARREAELLAAQTRVGTALTIEIEEAGPLIFTDMPGVAAAAGVGSRLQAFEARQLLDQGLASESELLHELANGTVPLAVIDYLGNWLTPGVVEILQRRYAHDGSLGTFDLYSPVAAGSEQPLDPETAVAMSGLHLSGYHLTPPAGATYEPGELLPLTLNWRREATTPDELVVVLRLATLDGTPLLETERPLLYGVYPPAAWPEGATVQHMQPLALPTELLDGRYILSIGLHDREGYPGPFQPLTTIDVVDQGGRWFEETNHFVPARLMQAWAELGGVERIGMPLTPAVPFAWGRLQCFELACLELRDEQARQRPLGERLYLAETIRGAGCGEHAPEVSGLCPGFVGAPEQFAELGRPLSGELARNGWLVQWTETARLERAPNEATVNLGRLGDESLRLPPGTPYRWP